MRLRRKRLDKKKKKKKNSSDVVFSANNLFQKNWGFKRKMSLIVSVFERLVIALVLSNSNQHQLWIDSE